jgi:hypothetical protein
MLKLGLLFVVLVAGCGDDGGAVDAACWRPGPCDPMCALPTAGVCPSSPCNNIGAECNYFEYRCVCGADRTWQFQSTLPFDMAVVRRD